MLLPFASTNFYSAARVTEQQDITEDMFKQRVETGEYRDIEIYTSDLLPENQTQSKKANDKIEGLTEPTKKELTQHSARPTS